MRHAVVNTASGWLYSLRIQKQPGTAALPVHLMVQLPPGARVVSAEPAGTTQNGQWHLEAQLTRDVTVQLQLQAP